MPKKKENETVYKTEEQLKEEARIREQAEAAAAAAAKPKSKAEKKLENFWYHYKWQFIAVVLSVVLLAVFVRDMVFREKPDTTIIIVSTGYIDSEEVTAFSEALSELAADFNGDKKTIIGADLILLAGDDIDSQTAQQDYANTVKLVTVVSSGIDPIYLLDSAAYSQIIQMGQSEGDPVDKDNVFIPQSIPADDLGFPDMRFYLRQGSGGDDYYEYCKDLFFAIGN